MLFDGYYASGFYPDLICLTDIQYWLSGSSPSTSVDRKIHLLKKYLTDGLPNPSSYKILATPRGSPFPSESSDPKESGWLRIMCTLNGKLHNPERPSVIVCHPSTGRLRALTHYLNGNITSGSMKPASILLNESGGLQHISYRSATGLVHCDYGPAVVSISNGMVDGVRLYHHGFSVTPEVFCSLRRKYLMTPPPPPGGPT